jgi:hypothetical protein
MKILVQHWMKGYNEFSPHEAIGDLSNLRSDFTKLSKKKGQT